MRRYALLILLCLARSCRASPRCRRSTATSRASCRRRSRWRESGDLVDIRFQDESRYKKPVGIYWLHNAALALSGQGADAPIWVYRLVSVLGGHHRRVRHLRDRPQSCSASARADRGDRAGRHIRARLRGAHRQDRRGTARHRRRWRKARWRGSTWRRAGAPRRPRYASWLFWIADGRRHPDQGADRSAAQPADGGEPGDLRSRPALAAQSQAAGRHGDRRPASSSPWIVAISLKSAGHSGSNRSARTCWARSPAARNRTASRRATMC